MSCKIEWNTHYVYKKYCGNITPIDLKRIDREILNDIRFASLSYIISDFLDVNRIDFTNEEIVNHSKHHSIPSIYNPHLKLVLVADKPSLRKKLLYYIENMQSIEWETRLFETLEEAYAWVQLK